MPQKSFDDPDVRAAMSAYLQVATALDEAAQAGSDARRLLDLAESKAMAAMQLRRRLEDLGWKAPEGQRTTT